MENELSIMKRRSTLSMADCWSSAVKLTFVVGEMSVTGREIHAGAERTAAASATGTHLLIEVSLSEGLTFEWPRGAASVRD
jgi:hypothetical protein